MAKAIRSTLGDGSRKIIILDNRICKECGKEFEPKTSRSEYCSKICSKIAANRRHKDKTRHGGKRQRLIKKNGLICSKCGKEGSSFDIVAHHSTFYKYYHKKQVLLCRSCHAKEHDFGKPGIETILICEQCQNEFLTTSTIKKYCSNKCKRKAEYLRNSEKIKNRVKQWRIKNPEKLKVNKRRYYLKKRCKGLKLPV